MRFAALAAVLILAGCARSGSDGPSEVTLTSRVIVHNVDRFGVNLGTWTSWGAEQLSSNIIKNPGFEGMIDRAIVIVRNPSADGFDDSEAYLARPDHFWDGASYEVLSGPRAGESGDITTSSAQSQYGLPHFSTSRSVDGLRVGDAISLTRTSDREEAADWWFTKDAGTLYEPAPEPRPGSSGARSLRIGAAGAIPARAISYVDAIGERAGKLLPLAGEWRLTFWSRLESGQAKLQIALGRDGSRSLLDQDIPLSRSWHKTELTFQATDNGPPGIISLKFQISAGPAGNVLLDDVDLRRSSDADFPFRSEVREVLSELHPGYIRDWEGQLGDTLKNRTAPPGARRTTRYRPGDTAQADYAYSLPEFLDLALDIQASPWIVIPTTFSKSECAETGAFLLSDPRYRSFPEILVEFGNENWNGIFRPGGIGDNAIHGEAASRCFSAMRERAGPLPLRTVINAQHANPDSVDNLAHAALGESIVAVAPYFLHSLPAGLPIDEAQGRLFEGDGGRMLNISTGLRNTGQELAVYEVGPHTNEGNAPDDERLHVTSGPASASALAITMLDGLALGARRQCVYSLSGYDNWTSDGKGFVRLWGITRDLGPTRRLRATGLSLELMNQALRGEMLQTESDNKQIHVYAFERDSHWSVVIASSSPQPRTVNIRFPTGVVVPRICLKISAYSPMADNDAGPNIGIIQSEVDIEGEIATVDLPGFGLAAVVGDGKRKNDSGTFNNHR